MRAAQRQEEEPELLALRLSWLEQSLKAAIAERDRWQHKAALAQREVERIQAQIIALRTQKGR